MENHIKKLFLDNGFDLSEDKAHMFAEYYSILAERSKSINLTSVIDFNEVCIKHFLDSASGLEFVSGSCCDVGSGAGFPAIPLKILKPELQMLMLDSVNKKVTFLSDVINLLLLENTSALHIRAEDAARLRYREIFDTVTARAVARLNVLSEYCLPLVKVGGVFVAYKGSAEDEIAQSKRALKILGGEIAEVKRFELPDGAGTRSIIVIKKVKPTPLKYPRGKGKERSAPLS